MARKEPVLLGIKIKSISINRWNSVDSFCGGITLEMEFKKPATMFKNVTLIRFSISNISGEYRKWDGGKSTFYLGGPSMTMISDSLAHHKIKLGPKTQISEIWKSVEEAIENYLGGTPAETSRP